MQAQQAKGFCQGCLYQFHLFLLHPKPLAQGLQGLMSRALTWRRATNTQKSATTWEIKGVLSSCPTLQPNRTSPFQAVQRLEAYPEGERRMVEDQGLPPSRACSEPGKAAFLLLPQPPERQGVPWSTRAEWGVGRYGILPRYVGARERWQAQNW